MTAHTKPHAEDILFGHVQTVHNLGSVVDAMEEYARFRTAELEADNRRLRAQLDRISCLDFGVIHEDIAKEALEGLSE